MSDKPASTAYIPPHMRDKVQPHEAAKSASANSNFNTSYRPTFSSSNHRRNFQSNYSGYQRSGNFPHSRSMEYHITDAEVKEQFDRNTESADVSVYEGSNVSVQGPPIQPITQFIGSGIHNNILLAIAQHGYKKPTAVQKYSIPAILNNQDLIVTSQTGSGKTAAFMLPVLTHLIRMTSTGNPLVIDLVPTRELALQELDETKKFIKHCPHLNPICIYGGSSINEQIRSLRYGVDILIATPGRLIDIIEHGNITLHDVSFLILDECDRMLDMGFEPQIKHIIKDFDMPPNDNRQNLLFSATFPREVENLAFQFMRRSVCRIEVGLQDAPSLIQQRFVYVSQENKIRALLAEINEISEGQILVFAERKASVDEIENYLYEQNVNVVAIHGDRNMIDRMDALQLFTDAKAQIMIATDVAARGLDIANVAVVINLDLPTDLDSYTHRIGRTGRAGRTGKAISFYNENNYSFLNQLLYHFRETNQEIPVGLEQYLSDVERTNNYRSNNYRSNNYRRGRSTFRKEKSYNNMNYRPYK